MQGYQRSTLKLVFDDPDLEGLEVKARRLTIREILEVSKLRDSIDLTADDALEQVEALATVLSKPLLAWNLEVEPADGEDPVPVELTPAALVDMDLAFLLAVTSALMAASVRVAPPLPRPSDDGGPLAGLSIPMEALSPSPESLLTPA